MYRRTARLVQVLVLMLLPALHGCAAAAGAAAGTAAGLAYSERGSQTDVAANTTTIAMAATDALRSMNITITETETDRDEDEVTIKGKQGDRDVVVDIDGNRETGSSHIEVTVSKNVVDYDRDRATRILSEIVRRL